MAVSKMFQSGYTIISKEPFIKNSKYYVTVVNNNTKNKRDVRWYSESEYAKLYGEKAETFVLNLKERFGFEQGPILVVRRNRMEDETFLRQSNARYIMGIGWYFPSDEVLPSDAPANFKYLLLGWKEFAADETHMKPIAEIASTLDGKAQKGQWIKFAKS